MPATFDINTNVSEQATPLIIKLLGGAVAAANFAFLASYI